MYLLLSTHTPENISIRFGVLLGIGFLSGISLGTLVGIILELDPSIIATSTMLTSLIFGIVSYIALQSTTTYWLFLQSTIAMTALGLLVFSILPFFFSSMYWITNILNVASFVMVCSIYR